MRISRNAVSCRCFSGADLHRPCLHRTSLCAQSQTRAGGVLSQGRLQVCARGCWGGPPVAANCPIFYSVLFWKFSLACLWLQTCSNRMLSCLLIFFVQSQGLSFGLSVSDMDSNSRYATQQLGLLVTQNLQSFSFHGYCPIGFTLQANL